MLATASNRERFLASGADHVMMKPLRLSDMLAAVIRFTPNRGRQMEDLTGNRLGSDESVTVKQAHDQLGESARRQLQELNRIGIALSAERDTLKLRDFILTTMRRLTNADGASLWLKTVGDDGQPQLVLSASQNHSIDSPYQAFNVPVDDKTVVGYAVNVGTSQIYDDAYNQPPGKPPAGKGFDAQYGYRTKSMLAVPMRNHNNEVVGAVQLINAKRSFETKLTVENVPDEVVSFRSEDLEMIESIASQAAIAIDNQNLSASIEFLFDGFVRTSLSALELRDPSVAGRSYRVEALTTSLARAVSGIADGKYRDVRLTEDEFKELRYACLLHDVGVIGVREHILIKAKKLLPGQLEVIQARFDFLVRSVQVKSATEKLDVMRNRKNTSQRLEDIDRRLAQEIDQLHRWIAAIVQANEPSMLTDDTASILEQLSTQTFLDLSGTPHPMLDPHEFRILSIRKGVLDPEERLEMESHVTHSFELVSKIPWPPSMRSIPEIVYTHHERLDGSGYPRGLTGDQISLQTRMLTIADIYDALTAQDRSYKRAVSTEVALEILRAEANEGKLDKDLLDVFVSRKVFLAATSQRSAAAKSSGTARVTKVAAPTKTPVADSVARAEQPTRRAMDAEAASVSAGAGHGPLDALLHDQSVSEIMVNGPDEVFIERRGVLTQSEVRFDDENQLLETIQRILATTGRHIDVQNPIVEARLPDGSRVNAIIPPASNRGPALTIRKFTNAVVGMDDLTREASLSPAMAEFLEAAVLGRLNILVSGGADSGKTATLNVIARFIPHNQRVITIEDGPELRIGHPHVVSLLHRPANVEGKGELTIRQLLRYSLRMRPDRLLVSEVRGAEALDMLQAMNTGHDGSMSTIYSNSARDALSRLETMVLMASIDIPFEAVRAQIASAVNLIVHQARMPDGRRKIAQIAEVVGYDSNGAILRDIFLLGMGADLRLEYNATGYVPTSLDKAAFYGVQVDLDLFDPVKSRFVPAGSEGIMPVAKDSLISGQRGSEENAVRQVVVVPFSSHGPGDQRQQPTHSVQASPNAPLSTMASTPEMQEEMHKLIDAARSAVADLQTAGLPVAPPEAYAPTPPPTPAEAATERVAPAAPQALFATAVPPPVPAHQAALVGFVQAILGNIVGARRQTDLKELTLDLMLQALDARDPYTVSHSMRVSEIAGRLGRHLGLGDREVELLRTAGSLHDLGMIGVRDDVLNKVGPLTDEEWAVMRRHPDIGADMMAQHQAFAGVAPLVRHHHEHWDGTGYPAGLKGDVIPFGARILAAADSFDAMTSERLYIRSVMTPIEAVEEISRRANQWYDPNVVDALREIHGLSPL
ncbi:MAG TPA: ATPase, T2SS/T4P/T4SS family [Candidatus Acidoferrum sp.]|nr:ATPase, T2SS/T4P/T4SS family [Candidatus Acidoferrum sp.]